MSQLVYERHLWPPFRQEGYENGNAFCGTNGMLIPAKYGGWQLFGPKNERAGMAATALRLEFHCDVRPG